MISLGFATCSCRERFCLSQIDKQIAIPAPRRQELITERRRFGTTENQEIKYFCTLGRYRGNSGAGTSVDQLALALVATRCLHLPEPIRLRTFPLSWARRIFEADCATPAIVTRARGPPVLAAKIATLAPHHGRSIRPAPNLASFGKLFQPRLCICNQHLENASFSSSRPARFAFSDATLIETHGCVTSNRQFFGQHLQTVVLPFIDAMLPSLSMAPASEILVQLEVLLL